MIKSDTAAAPQSRLSRPTSPRLDEEAPWDQRLSGGEAGLCRGAAAEHASASGKVGPGRQPTAKERRDMVIVEKEFEPKG